MVNEIVLLLLSDDLPLQIVLTNKQLNEIKQLSLLKITHFKDAYGL